VYNDPAYKPVIDTLKQQLVQLQKKYGDSYELAEKILEHDKPMFGKYKNVY